MSRIIPALAGNTAEPPPNDDNDKDHPRSRGEYHVPACLLGWVLGSSPLSRGIPQAGRAAPATPGIIPALAGNTGIVYWTQPVRADHPRSRGEYGVLWEPLGLPPGSSPLSRGIRAKNVFDRYAGRIIPALAGNTPRRGLFLWSIWDHPRSRGEYRDVSSLSISLLGSSPLSRGILWKSTTRVVIGGIIPALAGNTVLGHQWGGAARDHPRSRGEYPTRCRVCVHQQGSSPLSRGILR